MTLHTLRRDKPGPSVECPPGGSGRLGPGLCGPLHSCGSSNNSLKAMKTMTQMIAAKNMAGKETVDSSMLSACPHPPPLHNAIVCANPLVLLAASARP